MEKVNDIICNCTVIHQDVIDRVKSEISDDGTLFDMADIFKVLSDPTRLKIINALLLAEMCVCDLSALLVMSKPAVSHHLKVLRQTSLVKYRKEGKSAYYALRDKHIQELFDQSKNHVRE